MKRRLAAKAEDLARREAALRDEIAQGRHTVEILEHQMARAASDLHAVQAQQQLVAELLAPETEVTHG